jgi:hypothetical protein
VSGSKSMRRKKRLANVGFLPKPEVPTCASNVGSWEDSQPYRL